MTTAVSAYAATSATEPLTKTTITRRDVGPRDVAFDIHFAGICHSDIHTVRAEWGDVTYPIVPGHEIAGIVTEVGSEVTQYTVGDRVGVGCFVDSCRECEFCLAGEEQYCDNPGMVGTYNGVGRDGQPTQVVVGGRHDRPGQPPARQLHPHRVPVGHPELRLLGRPHLRRPPYRHELVPGHTDVARRHNAELLLRNP